MQVRGARTCSTTHQPCCPTTGQKVSSNLVLRKRRYVSMYVSSTSIAETPKVALKSYSKPSRTVSSSGRPSDSITMSSSMVSGRFSPVNKRIDVEIWKFCWKDPPILPTRGTVCHTHEWHVLDKILDRLKDLDKDDKLLDFGGHRVRSSLRGKGLGRKQGRLANLPDLCHHRQHQRHVRPGALEHVNLATKVVGVGGGMQLELHIPERTHRRAGVHVHLPAAKVHVLGLQGHILGKDLWRLCCNDHRRVRLRVSTQHSQLMGLLGGENEGSARAPPPGDVPSRTHGAGKVPEKDGAPGCALHGSKPLVLDVRAAIGACTVTAERVEKAVDDLCSLDIQTALVQDTEILRKR